MFGQLLKITALVLLLGSPACATTPDQPEEPLSSTYHDGLRAWQLQRAERPVDPWVFPPIAAPLNADLPYRVILDDRRPVPGSRSVGTASNGDLAEATTLPLDGTYLFVLPSHHFRQAHFATRELAEVLDAAAMAVAAEYPSSRLALGDASLSRGGNIDYHASHESGRDIDLPFFMKRSGERVETTAFVRFGANGRNGALEFDVERNWSLVRAFLTLSDDTVQWAFVSRDLAQLLLDHARSIGEPDELVRRASAVLWQPSDSSPHDDHFHVRLYCAARDRLEGCINYGPEWDWANHATELHATRVQELLRALGDSSPSTRVDAIEFMIRIEGFGASVPLAQAAAHQPPIVQLAILRAIRRFRPSGVDREIVTLAASGGDAAVRLAALEVAATYPLPAAADMLVALTGEAQPIAAAAARGLLLIEEASLVPDLLNALETADSTTRAILGESLMRITGFTADIDWGADSAQAVENTVDRYRRWLEEHEGTPRLDWLCDGLEHGGYTIPSPWGGPESAAALVDLIDQPMPYRLFAHGALELITNEPRPSSEASVRRQKRYWRRVLNRD